MFCFPEYQVDDHLITRKAKRCNLDPIQSRWTWSPQTWIRTYRITRTNLLKNIFDTWKLFYIFLVLPKKKSRLHCHIAFHSTKLSSRVLGNTQYILQEMQVSFQSWSTQDLCVAFLSKVEVGFDLGTSNLQVFPSTVFWPTTPKTNMFDLKKLWDWVTTFLLKWPLFRGLFVFWGCRGCFCWKYISPLTIFKVQFLFFSTRTSFPI